MVTVEDVADEDLSVLHDLQIGSLMDEALRRAKVRMDPKQRRRLIIRSVSVKQRPRRPS